jgi:metal-dependent amidase/aminoacylase/carboxypeptidase family protein
MVAPPIIAAARFDVFYIGKEAHASAFPELGINAADALTIAQTAVGLLRQHIHHTERIHGIITKGGDAPNVIPADTSARYIARAASLEKLAALLPRVIDASRRARSPPAASTKLPAATSLTQKCITTATLPRSSTGMALL